MWNFPWSMVIFHNFLQLPEGIMYSLESLSEHGDHGGLTIPWVRKTCHVWNDGCGNSPTHGWMIQCEFLESIRAIIVGFMSQNPGTLGTLKWLVMDDYSPNMIIIGHRVWSIPTITYIYRCKYMYIPFLFYANVHSDLGDSFGIPGSAAQTRQQTKHKKLHLVVQVTHNGRTASKVSL
jgi:hypothetical protein